MLKMRLQQKTLVVLGLGGLLLGGILLKAAPTWGSDLIWRGHYRIEGTLLDKPELAGDKQKAYFLHQLALMPKFVPADGFVINGRLHIMSSSLYPNSQLGATLGSGPGEKATTGGDDSNVLAQAEKMGAVKVSQLYLTWKTENGALLVGRLPLHFGLGMTYNSGQDPFAHWLENRDLVGYKFVVGNLFFTPMYGKVSGGPGLNTDDDVNELLFHGEYDNPETALAIGIFLEKRTASSTANDVPTNPFPGSTRVGSWDSQQVNFYFHTEKENYKLALEGGFRTGSMGLKVADGEISMDSTGLAIELSGKTQAEWNYGIKAGYATGDNVATTTKYEGYIFDRNYDVATLLFNHPMGQWDALQTTLLRGATTDLNGASPASNNVDNEALSNAIYLAPYFDWRRTDQTTLTIRAIYALLSQSQVSRDLGYELDLVYTYHPFPSFKWQTDFAVFAPGGAWKDGTNNFATGITYGIMTKAAINF